MEMRKTGFAEPVEVDAHGGIHVLSRERINTIFNRGKATAFKLMSERNHTGVVTDSSMTLILGDLSVNILPQISSNLPL
jgi:hypothetical protein